VAADDGGVVAPGHDRLDEAELAQAALEGVEFLFADAAGVGRIGTKLIEGDLLDGKRRR
jgi:hypothetical protein